MHKSTNEIISIIDMLEENNEPVTRAAMYACSYYEMQRDLVEDVSELVDKGVLAWLSDDTYTAARCSSRQS